MNKANAKENSLGSGKGYLIGHLIGIAMGIVVFLISENFVVALATGIPMAVTLGISLEKKQEEPFKVNRTLLYVTVLGLLVFMILVTKFYLLKR